MRADEAQVTDPVLQAEMEECKRRFSEMTARHKRRLAQLAEDLRRKKTEPRPFDPDGTFEDLWFESARKYFHSLKSKVSPYQYLRWVKHWHQKNLEFLKLPAIQRQSFPLLPPMAPADLKDSMHIKEMPVISEFFHSKGGNKPSPGLRRAERNQIIRDGKAQGLSDLEICEELDLNKIPLPQEWDGKSWAFLHENDLAFKERIHRLFSKIAVKARR